MFKNVHPLNPLVHEGYRELSPLVRRTRCVVPLSCLRRPCESGMHAWASISKNGDEWHRQASLLLIETRDGREEGAQGRVAHMPATTSQYSARWVEVCFRHGLGARGKE
jgi:hypothetical protein